MPRFQRVLSETGTYHVMLRGNERKNLFFDDEDRLRFLEILAFKKKETGLILFAYCLMDNHVHLLLREGNETLGVTMKRINVSFASYFNHKYHRIGHLFQDRFKSEPVEDERYLLAVIRYIHQNPVKAGIVDHAGRYKWSSHSEYVETKTNLHVDIDLILSIFASDQIKARLLFAQFMEDESAQAFLDVEESASKDLLTSQQVMDFLKNRAIIHGIEGDYRMLNSDRAIIEETIRELKMRSTLSIRRIAELLGVDRGLVQRVKIK